jgi:hypothetical protein
VEGNIMVNTNNVKKLTRASMLLVFALVIIFIGSRLGGSAFNQVVVGPLVNAVIIAAVLITDLKFGILVSLLTPVLAFITGQFTMLPFVPFIMAGNAIMAVSVGVIEKLVKKHGIYIGIVVGAVLKALFLMISVNYLIALFNLPLSEKQIKMLGVAMSWSQLYTALAGGVVAVIFFNVFKKVIKR